MRMALTHMEILLWTLIPNAITLPLNDILTLYFHSVHIHKGNYSGETYLTSQRKINIFSVNYISSVTSQYLS